MPVACRCGSSEAARDDNGCRMKILEDMNMDCKPLLDAIRDNIRQVIVGKDRVIDHLLISLLCSGPVSYTHLITYI